MPTPSSDLPEEVDLPPLHVIATCDLVAIVRGRALLGAPAASGASVGWVPADLALTGYGPIAEDQPFGSHGDLRLVAVDQARLVLPACNEQGIPETVVDLGRQMEVGGAGWDCCPRQILESAVDDLRNEFGLELRMAFEHEFMLMGLDSSPAFSLQRLRDAEPFGSRLVRALEQNGYEPENWLAEYADGQFEITLAPADPLTAADRAILLRELVRDGARRAGHRATFAPIVDPQGTGNGVHVHWSLWDTDGRPVTQDQTSPQEPSRLARQFAGGILRHASALCAVSAPSVTSYMRLGPHRWSSAGAFMAQQDREAMLRICPPADSELEAGAEQFNIEYRACDATANPWLVAAMLIRAGLAGLIQPAGEEPEARDLPTSLDQALKALESDPIASLWLPATLLETYLLVKREEIRMFDGLDDVTRCERTSSVY